MMRLLTPLLIVGIAGAIFFYLSDPVLQQIDQLRQDKAKLEESLNYASQLRQKQKDLIAKRSEISVEQQDRLGKFLPDNVDNVRLIIDLNDVAQDYGMSIRNIKIKTDEGKTEGQVIQGGGVSDRGSVTLGFSVSGPYNNFLAFVDKLARSLRLVDISGISFSSTDKGDYDYNVEIQTYWLK